jgi:tyrosyl-tRNA synthetase
MTEQNKKERGLEMIVDEVMKTIEVKKGTTLLDAIMLSGLVKSRSEARRLAKQGAITLL